MGKYKNYEDLKQHEREGEDYVVILWENDSRIAVIAPHGGGIEPVTVEKRPACFLHLWIH
jgi:phage replication-related protein YjqB (UPF0714/DUF867 family)